MFSTAEDNQAEVGIKVFQGERELATYNKLLGNFNLQGIPPARRGTPQIEVTFDIDANGILSVKAADKGTGKENKITIKANSGLNEAEIQSMIKDAELNAEADKKQRELITQRNTAESFINEARGDLEKYGDKLSEEERSKLTESMAALELVIKGDNLEVLQEKTTAFMQNFGPLTNLKYQSENPNFEAEQPEAQPTSADNTVDVEATEVKSGT